MRANRTGSSSAKVGARLNLPSQPGDEAGSISEVDGRKGVQSVDIALAIVRVLERSRSALTLSEIAQTMSEPASKMHHYLVSLVRNGLVVQKEDARYDLGAYALQLGLSALGKLDVIDHAVSGITRFRDETGEAAFVAVWGNHGPTIIRYVEGARMITVEAPPGLVLPLLLSSTGNAFMAWQPRSIWNSILESELANVAHSKRISGSPDQIIRKTLRQRVAAVDGSLSPRISGLSVPVFKQSGHLACVLTTLGWRGELNVDPKGRTAARLIQTGLDVSTQLGFKSEQGATVPRDEDKKRLKRTK